MSKLIRSLVAAFPIALVAMLVAVGAAAGGQGATKTAFTGSETFLGFISPGIESFPNGNYHVRDGIILGLLQSDDPRLNNAEDVLTYNGNYQLVPPPVLFTGRYWGKFTLTNEGGYWKGSYTAVRDDRGFTYGHLEGKGEGGYTGLQVRMWFTRESPDVTVPITLWGIIIEPGK